MNIHSLTNDVEKAGRSSSNVMMLDVGYIGGHSYLKSYVRYITIGMLKDIINYETINENILKIGQVCFPLLWGRRE